MADTIELTQFVVDSPICTECGGVCCKQSPGICWPSDISPLSAARIMRMVRREHYAIDWWEGDPREGIDELDQVYYVRPAIKNMNGRYLDPSWGGECTFLDSNGCMLPPEIRPRQCLALTPLPLDERNYSGGCDSQNHRKEDAAIAWIPHQNIISTAVHRIRYWN